MILKKSDRLVFELDMPPSVNDYYMKTPNGVRINGRSRLWINAALCAMDEGGVSQLRIENTVRLDVMLHPAKSVKMDIDNRLKALLDLFERAGILEDDDQVQVMKVIKTPIVKERNGLLVVMRGCQLKKEMKRFEGLRA